MQSNHELRTVVGNRAASALQAPSLASRAGLLTVNGSTRAWVSALKKEQGRDGVVLRMFDVCGHGDGIAPGGTVTTRLAYPVHGMAHTDIIELNATPLPPGATNGTWKLPLGRCAIETFLLDAGLT